VEPTYISRSAVYNDVFSIPRTRTTTLGSNAIIEVNTTEAAGGYSTSIPAFLATNGGQRTTIGPGQISMETTLVENGVPLSTLSIMKPTGDYDTFIYWTGGNDANIRWINYQGAERTARNIAITWDLVPQTFRPLVLDTEGRQGLGAINYFSTTQTSTPATTTGSNGDFYFSTA
jgi:hypothetical protein